MITPSIWLNRSVAQASAAPRNSSAPGASSTVWNSGNSIGSKRTRVLNLSRIYAVLGVQLGTPDGLHLLVARVIAPGLVRNMVSEEHDGYSLSVGGSKGLFFEKPWNPTSKNRRFFGKRVV
jgi:hypothetical protein